MIILLVYDLGHLSTHMMLHIATMNVVAPGLAALAVSRYLLSRPIKTTASLLWTAWLIQMMAFWTWHAPAVHIVVTHSTLLTWLAQGTLLVAALTFWLALLTISSNARWQAVLALLLTGKLACLLAALLIFAPRTLYTSAAHLGHAAGTSAAGALEDQQLAGLFMITACPLSYLIAAVIITVQLIAPQHSPGNPAHQNAPAG
ncbi:cytochrome c oxidase assembly protein [Bradyrhizobium sp. 5.13L]